MRSLPPRLQAVIDLLSPCALLADIGTDHGLVPVAAVRGKKAKKALACDLRSAPLEGAKDFIRARAMDEFVETVQTNGMQGLQDRGIDAVTFAGMSGALMVQICNASPDVMDGVTQLIAQPNTEAFRVRRFANEMGFHLLEERLLQSSKRYFLTIRFERRDGPDAIYESPEYSKEDGFRLGPDLLRRRDTTAASQLKSQRARLATLAEKSPEVHAPDLERIERALRLFR